MYICTRNIISSANVEFALTPYLCSEKTNDMKESKTKDTKKKGTNKKDTKNLFTRIKLLDELLSDRYHNYSMEDIVDKMNDRLEDMGCKSVSRRCVENILRFV